MTGYGSRFVKAGYRDLKPFIKVHNIPIIQWIIQGMYPNERNIIFVCRKEHLDMLPEIEQSLNSLLPSCRIAAIDNWVKKGPVYDVLRAANYIDDNEPAIINYCDFYMIWDYQGFLTKAKERNCAGAIPCYTGFHPHLLIEDNFYASCNTDEDDNLIEIREKYSFEKDKAKAKHSPGTYYFSNGALLKEYCNRLIEDGKTINGEFYASLPYNYMVADNLKVWIPSDIPTFCQWGTPEDLKDYLFWVEYTSKVLEDEELIIQESNPENFRFSKVTDQCGSLKIKKDILDEKRYLNWNGSKGYYYYKSTIKYWETFINSNRFLAKPH